MAITRRDVKVYEALAVVTIDGFEPEREVVDGHVVESTLDDQGLANWLCDAYGMASDHADADDENPGILWTDYDGPGLEFDVLIAADEVEALTKFATESGYTVLKIKPVTEPKVFGDGAGTVDILKHRDGWVILGD